MYSAKTLASSCSPHRVLKRSSTAAWKVLSSVTASDLAFGSGATEGAFVGEDATRGLFALLATSTGADEDEEEELADDGVQLRLSACSARRARPAEDDWRPRLWTTALPFVAFRAGGTGSGEQGEALRSTIDASVPSFSAFTAFRTGGATEPPLRGVVAPAPPWLAVATAVAPALPRTPARCCGCAAVLTLATLFTTFTGGRPSRLVALGASGRVRSTGEPPPAAASALSATWAAREIGLEATARPLNALANKESAPALALTFARSSSPVACRADS
mmetsp:Transcript_1847/g.4307  ORF Transcript_1847/g.4307 Transcript_1847/m.4307 type:complete len:276 (+) Transcript_1847:973-1800(+)